MKAKKEIEKETTWNWQIDRKKKLVEGSNDDSGYSTSLLVGYVTPFFGLKTTIEGTYEDTDLNGNYKDTKTLKSKIKVDYPIPPVSLGVQYDFSQTEDKVADPDLAGKIKKRNRDLSLSLNYPVTPGPIIIPPSSPPGPIIMPPSSPPGPRGPLPPGPSWPSFGP